VSEALKNHPDNYNKKKLCSFSLCVFFFFLLACNDDDDVKQKKEPGKREKKHKKKNVLLILFFLNSHTFLQIMTKLYQMVALT
jgi:hypothetical protein